MTIRMFLNKWAILILFKIGCLIHLGDTKPKVISNADEPDISNKTTLDCLGIHDYCTGNYTGTCYCDEDCVMYGDCCWGALQNKSSLSRVKEHSTIDFQFRCEKLLSVHADGSKVWKQVYLIATCPSHWEEYDEVRKHCEVGGQFPDLDAFLRIPVTGTLTHRTYRNIFCAICHRDNEVVFWNIKASCPNEEFLPTTTSDPLSEQNTGSESENTNSSSPEGSPSTFTEICNKPEVVLHKSDNDVLPIVSMPSEISKFVHECLELPASVILIEQCSKDWLRRMENFPQEREKIETNCATYIALVARSPSMTPKVYKNKFCAMCNDDFTPEINNISCFIPKFHIMFLFPRSGGNWPRPPDKIGRPATSTTHVTGRPGFQILFDINIGNDRKSAVGYKSYCSSSQTYDIISKRCRELYCGKDGNYDGKCTKKPLPSTIRPSGRRQKLAPKDQKLTEVTQTVKNRNITRTIDNCVQIRLERHEFSVLEKDNESIVIVNGSGVRLQDGEYELEDNGTGVFMCATYRDSYIPLFDDVDGYLSVICTSISIISLCMKILLHFLVEKSANLPSKMVLQLSAALVIAQLLFLIGVPRTELGTLCQAIGVLIHYTFLASFFWMNSLAFDISRTFYTGRLRHGSNRTLAYYCVYAWGGPLLIVTASIILEWSGLTTSVAPEYGVSGCWISNRLALLLLFACPVGITLLTNFILLTVTVSSIASTVRRSRMAHENHTDRSKDRLRIFLYIKLSLIMGVTWILAFISPFANSRILSYLFIIFNSLQGLFILIAFSKFRKIFKSITKGRKWMQVKQERQSTNVNSLTENKYITTVYNYKFHELT